MGIMKRIYTQRTQDGESTSTHALPKYLKQLQEGMLIRLHGREDETFDLGLMGEGNEEYSDK